MVIIILVLPDLVDDWSTKTRSDIFGFYPYTWKVGLMLKEFELSIISNEWNWIDCFGPNLENSKSNTAMTVPQLTYCGNRICFFLFGFVARTWLGCFTDQVAMCGETFEVTFDLPFIDFLPETVPLKFFMRVSCMYKLLIVILWKLVFWWCIVLVLKLRYCTILL